MKSVLPAIVLLCVVALPLDAQQRPGDRFEHAELRTLHAATESLPPAAPTLEAHTAADDAARSGGILSTRSLIHAVGGAIVGGWIGLFGAQVAHSDWDEDVDGDFGPHRTRWTAAGVVAGLLGSRLVTRTTAPGVGPVPMRTERNRNVITAQEIRESRANNAYELVQMLRKEWLIPRGTNSWAETSGGVAEGVGRSFTVNIEEGRDKIIVYMDDVRIGGPEDLEDMSLDGITSIEFVGPRQATYLYGAGHGHGAIRLSTEVESPSEASS